MYPPIFKTCSASIAVKALLGTDPVRLYPFGKAPQDVQLPYVVWQTITGEPHNYLGDRPDVDGFTLQVDVYAETADSARAVVNALCDCIEPVARVSRWNGEDIDNETKTYRSSFDVDWTVRRQA